MLATTALRHGRRWAERLMVDQCVIRRTVGPVGEMDPNTGVVPPAQTIVVYSGKCKIQTYEPHESKPESGQHVFTVQRYHLHIPYAAGPVLVDDRIEIVASAMSPRLAGRRYRVSGEHDKSLATAQRLLIDEVTG